MRIFEKSGVNIAESVLPFKQFRLFADMENPSLPDNVREALIKDGEALLTKPYAPLSAPDYMRFVRDGDRSVYEGVYFERRDTVFALLLAEYADPAHMRAQGGETSALTRDYTAKVKVIRPVLGGDWERENVYRLVFTEENTAGGGIFAITVK